MAIELQSMRQTVMHAYLQGVVGLALFTMHNRYLMHGAAQLSLPHPCCDAQATSTYCSSSPRLPPSHRRPCTSVSRYA